MCMHKTVDILEPRPTTTAIGSLTVVPRKRRPMVSVTFENRPAGPLEYQGKVVLQPHIVVITPRSHRAYRVVTQEDAQWISQVIHEMVSQPVPKAPTPRRSRSSRSAPATSASSAAKNTATAADSATERRSPRGGSSSGSAPSPGEMK